MENPNKNKEHNEPKLQSWGSKSKLVFPIKDREKEKPGVGKYSQMT